MRVIVTGGAGYIGGQTVLRLLDQGHSVFAIDQVASDHLEHCGAKWMQSDFASEVALDAIRTFQPDAIIHCAGTSLVGPSMTDPKAYYENNFVKTKSLLEFMIANKISTRFVFSSSAATYGNPIITPIQEIDPTEPISPYGQSKLMIDWMLQSYRHAYNLDFVSFRYFNACGADSQARHGQRSGATHIIARLLESIKNNQCFYLYGDKYNTPDGTCVRDYIHVEDLAQAHIAAVDPSLQSGIYNLGTQKGHSNKEIIALAEKITQKNIQVQVVEQRVGDPPMLIADATKFLQLGLWQPKHDISDMIQHAWTWYKK
jgi:UDP-glucose 4-epimerase